MKEHSIRCNDDEVRAILDGRKTQLRRPVSMRGVDFIGPQGCTNDPEAWGYEIDDGYMVLAPGHHGPMTFSIPCPFGTVGDLIWVREAFGTVPWNSGAERYVPANDHDEQGVRYRATWDRAQSKSWRSSTQMPRWASRITLDVTALRVERVQEIDERCSMREGFSETWGPFNTIMEAARDGFIAAWDYAYGGIDKATKKPKQTSWASNPFVYVVEFKRSTKV